MKPQDIKTANQALLFIEGCINDFEAGVSDKDETIMALMDYTAQIIYLTEQIIYLTPKSHERHNETRTHSKNG